MNNFDSWYYFDAATRSTPINHELRLRGVPLMLELAQTERLLGHYDRAREIDEALSEYAEKHIRSIAPSPTNPSPADRSAFESMTRHVRTYQAKMFAGWMKHGNLDACRRWWDAHPGLEDTAIRYELFGRRGSESSSDGYIVEETVQFLDSRIDKFPQSIELRLCRAAVCIECKRKWDRARTDLDDAETIAGKPLEAVHSLRERLEVFP